MRFLFSLTAAAFVVSVVVAAANPLDGLRDLHLAPEPRTTAEQARISAATAAPDDFTKPSPFETRPAGAGTVALHHDGAAFSQPNPKLPTERGLDFRLGEALFDKLWVSSPASTKASDGLGPLFNARACRSCHVNNGRGRPPGAGETSVSLVLRLSVPGPDKDQPDPHYGGQLQTFALPAHPVEGQLRVAYDSFEVMLSEGEKATLTRPRYEILNPGYGPLSPQLMTSPRIAPQMIGLGLLEAIPAVDILSLADPDDRNGDGISGRPNIVMSAEFGAPMLGRFGWKAGAPTVKQQSADAFSGDIGISSPLRPAPFGDCGENQTACRNAPHGDGDARVFEIDDTALDLVTLYTRNLAVPMRRDPGDARVLRGKQVFHDVGCASCHTPSHVTHRLPDRPADSFQLIWPYTDLLLHDMGDGLADNRPEAAATGREWRTPPLWGIGLTKQVSGHTRFLHDGRARSVLEAVLWHGGEAKLMKQAVIDMGADDRAALIRFLESL